MTDQTRPEIMEVQLRNKAKRNEAIKQERLKQKYPNAKYTDDLEWVINE